MSGKTHKRIDDLIRLIKEMNTLHRELAAVVEVKLAAMKKADMDGMRVQASREHDLVGRISEREGFRRQIMEAIGGAMGITAKTARVMTVSQLAKRVGGKDGPVLLRVASELKESMARVARINRLAGAISLNVLGHLQAVFGAVASCGTKQVGYSGSGKMVNVRDRRLIETVG